MNITLIIPVHNEIENLVNILEDLSTTVIPATSFFSVIVVNDGSTDGTGKFIREMSNQYEWLSLLELKERHGQSKAIELGLKCANSDWIMLIDGDNQFYVRDIMKVIRARKNEDFVCTYRKNRMEDSECKILTSQAGNYIIRKFFKSNIFDLGSSLKLCKRKDLLMIRYFKNYHRYISLILEQNGLTYIQVPVEHKKRMYGYSKYKMTKLLSILKELIYLKFFFFLTAKSFNDKNY